MDTDHTIDFVEYQLPLGRQQLPVGGMVDLWWADLDSVGGTIMAGGTVPVQPREQVRARRFTSRFLLKMLLGAYLQIPGKDVRLVRNRFGKPGLDPDQHAKNLFFNISHSHQWMLFALNAANAVGVDIENPHRRTDPLRLANRYFSAVEVDALRNLDGKLRTAAFIRAWTHKEAVLKARGFGLAGNMGQVIVEINPALEPQVVDGGNAGSQWQLIDLALEGGMIGALAFDGNIAGINARCLLAP